MIDDARFERDLEAAFARMADRAPRIDASLLVDRLDRAGALGRPWWRRLGWLALGDLGIDRRLVAVILVLALLVGLLVGGSLRLFGGPSGALLLGRLDALATAQSDGSGERVLRPGRHREPRWSPDRRWILSFVESADGAGDEAVEVVHADGSGPSFTRAAIAARWSPSGRTGEPVVALVTPDGVIEVVDTSGHIVAAGPEQAHASGPIAWWPDGTALAWAAGPELYRLDLGERGSFSASLLSRTIRTSIQALAVKPDGTTIAAVAADCLGDCVAEVDLIPALGGAVAVLTSDVRADSGLDWDHAGASLLATAPDGTAWSVVRVSLDGRSTTVLPASALPAAASSAVARWVDDGTSILVETDDESGMIAVLATDAAGATPRPVVSGTLGADLLADR